MEGGSLERPWEMSEDRTEGTSVVIGSGLSRMVEDVVGWLDRIGGVNEGAIVVTSSSWYRTVVPSSDVEGSGSPSGGIAAFRALRRCPSEV